MRTAAIVINRAAAGKRTGRGIAQKSTICHLCRTIEYVVESPAQFGRVVDKQAIFENRIATGDMHSNPIAGGRRVAVENCVGNDGVVVFDV